MRRVAFGYASFAAVAITALLAGCGGGGGSSSPVPPPGAGPTPTPTPDPRLVGLADGVTASYDRTDESTVTVTTIGGGVGIGPAPNPSPTTTVVASTYRETVTTTGNQSFGGASGLYDVRTSVMPTGNTSQAYTGYSNVVDTYEGLIANATGFGLVSYGYTSKQSSTSNYISNDTSTSTLTATNTVPLRLVQFPAGAPFDPVLAFSLTETSQSMTTLPPGVVSNGPTSTTGRATSTLGADGSRQTNFTFTGNDGSSSSSDETIAGPGLAGKRIVTASDARLGNRTTTITTGAPAAGAGYTIAYAVTYAGDGAPQPVATSVPLWYPEGPAQRPLSVHVADRGMQAVPATCALPASLPTSGQATQTVTTSVSPFDGSVSQIDETRWDAAKTGTVCSIAIETYSGYDPTTGGKIRTGTSTTTRALRTVTVPAAWRRSARAGAAGGAVPFMLPPVRARLPELVERLRRLAPSAATHT